MAPLLFIGLIGLLLALSVRTLLWHLQNWQIREYRLDRMFSYLRTKQGFWGLFTLWFKPGFLPRPKRSGRIILIVLITLGLFCSITFIFIHIIEFILTFNSHIDNPKNCIQDISLPGCQLLTNSDLFNLKNSLLIALTIALLINERLIWIFTTIGVFLSAIPVKFQRKRIFAHAKQIIDNAPSNITKIGISGSYGKSSTKEILYHLLTSEYGKEAVLYNAENNNNELAIARLIIANKDFFNSKQSKVFLFETGAYKRGEIKQITDVVRPEIGILTGLNEQHIELFGSIRNIQLAEFELAESCTKKVFFNADSDLAAEIFADKEIEAVKIPITKTAAQNIESSDHETLFDVYGERFMIPWPGEFFVQNALLGIETARELGISPKKLKEYLSNIAPHKRALHSKTLTISNNSIKVLFDLYSQNPDGTLRAIDHLAQSEGQKIFIGMPLLELGTYSKPIHEQIFRSLKDLNATVYWLKKDHHKLGTKILGEKFHLINPRKPKDVTKIQELLTINHKPSAILLEGRIPQNILNLFK